VTATPSPSPTTVFLTSTDLVTQTLSGTVTTFTQTAIITSVSTVMVSPSSQPDNLNNSPGFEPVNAASHSTSSPSWCLLFGASWTLLLYSRMFW
jgi:hypothetical protein